MTQSDNEKQETTPLGTFSGAFMAATLAVLLYRLTHSIAISFATHPSHSSSLMAQKLSGAVQTLVIGLSTLATGLCTMATLGLVALGIKLLIEKNKQQI